MEISKYIPPNFEVGDVVLLYDEKFDLNWEFSYRGTLAIVSDINWRWEIMNVINEDGLDFEGFFKEFKLIKKKSRLVKLFL